MFGIFPVLDEFSGPEVILKVDFCDPWKYENLRELQKELPKLD